MGSPLNSNVPEGRSVHKGAQSLLSAHDKFSFCNFTFRKYASKIAENRRPLGETLQLRQDFIISTHPSIGYWERIRLKNNNEISWEDILSDI